MSEDGTLTLTEFLLARIAEDEAVARKMDERHDWSQSWELDLLYDDGPCIAVTRARVLAECEGRRWVVTGLKMAAARVEKSPTIAMVAAFETMQLVVKIAARAYADHPDFRDEWRA